MAPTGGGGGVTLKGGGCEWGLGVGWTVELKLNRKKKLDSNGGGGRCNTLPPPLDPPWGRFDKRVLCNPFVVDLYDSLHVIRAISEVT